MGLDIFDAVDVVIDQGDVSTLAVWWVRECWLAINE